MMENAELLETLIEAHFFQPCPDLCLATAPSLSSWGSFALMSTPSSRALFRKVRALQIGSNPFNSTQIDSDGDGEASQSSTKGTDEPSMSVTAKSVNPHVHVTPFY